MAQQSYAKTVLETALELAATKGEATAGDVSSAMFTQTRVQHKRVLNILGELAKAGRLVRIRQGVYGQVSRDDVQPDKREVMWRLLRMRRRIMVADLMEMAGAGKDYAREWLRMLEKNGVVRKEQAPGQAAVWILVNDQVKMPEDGEKAEKLRAIRRKKKADITARLDAIDTALADVRQILQTMEEEQ